MESRASGWYEDPNNAELLRYWDGVMWTEHTAMRRPPNGRPGGEPQTAAYPEQTAGYGSGPQDRVAGGQGHTASAVSGHSRAASGAWRGLGTIAPDGREYGSWLRRVGAYLVDDLVVALIALPFVFATFMDVMPVWDAWIRELTAQVEAGATQLPQAQVPSELARAIAIAGLTVGVIRLAYDVIALRKWGATVGKVLFGLRVRQEQARGLLTWGGALKRTVLKHLYFLFSGIPILSSLALGWTVVSYLWPLGDARRRALHDRFANSEVVRVRRGDTTW